MGKIFGSSLLLMGPLFLGAPPSFSQTSWFDGNSPRVPFFPLKVLADIKAPAPKAPVAVEDEPKVLISNGLVAATNLLVEAAKKAPQKGNVLSAAKTLQKAAVDFKAVWLNEAHKKLSRSEIAERLQTSLDALRRSNRALSLEVPRTKPYLNVRKAHRVAAAFITQAAQASEEERWNKDQILKDLDAIDASLEAFLLEAIPMNPRLEKKKEFQDDLFPIFVKGSVEFRGMVRDFKKLLKKGGKTRTKDEFLLVSANYTTLRGYARSAWSIEPLFEKFSEIDAHFERVARAYEEN